MGFYDFLDKAKKKKDTIVAGVKKFEEKTGFSGKVRRLAGEVSDNPFSKKKGKGIDLGLF